MYHFKEAEIPKGSKLNLGCGPGKKEGCIGIDIKGYPNVDIVQDVLTVLRAVPDGWISEVFSSHLVEHLQPSTRIKLANQVYRVLENGSIWHVTTPHWQSMWAYGDLTHVWPPVSESWYAYLSKEWRDLTSTGDGYKCDFRTAMTHGYLEGQLFELQAKCTKIG